MIPDIMLVVIPRILYCTMIIHATWIINFWIENYMRLQTSFDFFKSVFCFLSSFEMFLELSIFYQSRWFADCSTIPRGFRVCRLLLRLNVLSFRRQSWSLVVVLLWWGYLRCGLRRTLHVAELGLLLGFPSGEIGYVSGFLRWVFRFHTTLVHRRFWILWLVSKCDLGDVGLWQVVPHEEIEVLILHVGHAFPSSCLCGSRDDQ